MSRRSFDDLVAEAEAAPVDLSWFAGRATEERAPWGHAARPAELHDRIGRTGAFGCHSQRYLVEARKP